jgi:hypothetical protein
MLFEEVVVALLVLEIDVVELSIKETVSLYLFAVFVARLDSIRTRLVVLFQCIESL